MSTGGMICLVAFIFWSVFAFLAFSAAGDFFTFLRSIWFILFVVGYIVIMVIYSIGKRLGKNYDNEHNLY